MAKRPTLVAHRGYPTKFPENTLVGYHAAIHAGASWIETDIQVTRDHAVVLYHDATLERISGVDGSILEHTLAELENLSASDPSTFGDAFANEPIPTLEQLAKLIRHHPHVQAMIEIKQDSIDAHGIDAVVNLTHADLDSIQSQCVLISKNTDALFKAHANKAGGLVGCCRNGLMPPTHLLMNWSRNS